MILCPRPTCRTGYHVGCLRGIGSVWKDAETDDVGVSVSDGGGEEVVVVRGRGRPRGRPRGRGQGRGRGIVSAPASASTNKATPSSKAKNKGKGKAKAETLETTNGTYLEEELGYISPRAMRLLSTSPDTNHPLDLLDLVAQSTTTSASSSSSPSPNVLLLLQRIHHRQRNQLRSKREGSGVVFSGRGGGAGGGGSGGNEGASAKSKISVGSIVEVEELLSVKDETDDNYGNDNDGGGGGGEGETNPSVSAYNAPRRRFTQWKPHTNGITPSQSTKPESISRRQQRSPPPARPLTPNALLATLFLLPSPFSPHSNSTPQNIPVSYTPLTPVESTSNHISLPPHPNGTSPIPTSINDTNSNTNTNTKLLLKLASQPLLRGASYFPSLGPTGNVNPVLAARRLFGCACIDALVYLSTAWECPYEGMIESRGVIELAAQLFTACATEVIIADTIGAADPAATAALLKALVSEFGAARLTCHFHDTRGMALANVYAALQCGIRKFDASIAGLGGCPFAPGASGNVATEDVAYLFASKGKPTGLDFPKLMELRAEVAQWLEGEALHGSL